MTDPLALEITAALFFVIFQPKFVDLPIAKFARYHSFSAEVFMVFEFFKGHIVLADVALYLVGCWRFLVGDDKGCLDDLSSAFADMGCLKFSVDF